MEEIGRLLKNAREEKGLTLEDISKETMIQIRLLRALEEGDSSKFPGEVYFKGALRHYANAVGINPQELLEKYMSNSIGPEGEKAQTKVFKEIKPEEKDILKLFSLPINAKYLLIFVGVICLIIAGIVCSNMDTSLYDGEDIYVAEPNETEEELEEIIEEEAEDDITDSVVELELVEKSAREATYSVIGAEQIEINILFTADCWVKFNLDSQKEEEKTFRKGDELTLSAKERVWFRFGFPPAAQIEVNGIELLELLEERNPFNLTLIKKEN